jgi:nitric oxide reductase NorD protein
VHLLAPEDGPLSWVEQTLRTQRTLCDSIRRHFEQLRAHRQRLHRQLEGEEIDLQAYVDARTDFRAGQAMSQALYQTMRAVRRDLAVTLLVDVSGSTDAWVNAHRRIVDVEREALLFVCIALEGLRERYNVLAFSGVGPKGVTVRALKRFDEPYGEAIAKRIAALEPERYTRVGAALRHASALLMREPARHRLLILLSDGKPNDEDEYDGRYGVEDARQAIVEARLQGINCFCLTVDRHAASYLPHVFGARQYALLQKPELLPRVLLDWLRRLIGSS